MHRAQSPIGWFDVKTSLWEASASDLLMRTSSSDPTPGGGSIAAITGALGVGLMRMAVAITGGDALDRSAARLAALQERIADLADSDVRDFESLLAAYRLPSADDGARRQRNEAIQAAGITATEGPLALVEALGEALELSHRMEPTVKADVVSDVLAGRDIAAGAARAALHTADLNLEQLERLSAPRAAELRKRREDAGRRVEEAA